MSLKLQKKIMVREDFNLQLLPLTIKACLDKELWEPPVRKLYRKVQEGKMAKEMVHAPCILKKIKQEQVLGIIEFLMKNNLRS